MTAITSDSTHATGRQKSDVYDWRIDDRKGDLRYIHKSKLHIDHRYQRDNVSNARVLEIARDWSWMACGVLLVVQRRNDGKYWVFDGQHRALAAHKRDDVGDLPCCVFQGESIESEADAFLRANNTRGPMQKVDAFKAMLVSGDEVAIAVRDMVSRSGYEIKRGGGGSGVVSCVGTLMWAYRSDPSLCQSVWELCVELFGGDYLVGPFFASLFYLEQHCRKHGESVLAGKNRAKLIREGHEAIGKRMASAKAYHGKGGSKVAASGVAELLNKGRRTNTVTPIAI